MIRAVMERAGALAVAGLLVAGCQGPDTTAVPLEPAEPFLCEGVPARGMELALGGEVEARSDGAWHRDDRVFSCFIDSASDSNARALVGEGKVGTAAVAGNSEQTLEMWAGLANSRPIEADQPGSGYVYGSGGYWTAAWVCNERVLTIELLDVDEGPRDPAEDAERLLLSTLGWACGDQDPPPATS